MNIYHTKPCRTCKEEKQLICFSKDTRAKDGLQSVCKACAKLERDKNKHRMQPYFQAIREETREARRLYGKQYAKSNRAAYASYSAKRRATTLTATPGWFEEAEIKELYAQCEYIVKTSGVNHHVDHIVPLQSNIVCGLHCLANLRIITSKENLEKHNLHWPDMP